MSDEGYLEMVKTVLGEREAMLFDTLARRDSELVVAVFVQPDRVSHMFWRGIDPRHPLHAQTTPLARGAVQWIYREADRILGRTLDQLGPEDKLIVLSDHGFAPFRRALHLNRWLADQGLLVLRKGGRTSGESLADVDWSRTKAYAVGLNGIYLNLAGREANGIIGKEEAPALKRKIGESLRALRDPVSGELAVLELYDSTQVYHGPQSDAGPDLVVGYALGFRASWQTALGKVPGTLMEDNLGKWSGDHCIAASLVPGVLFTSFPLKHPVAGLEELAPLIGASMGVENLHHPEPH
jgi:predicted AlkP superfamily phosphohydrolase/phosphomutase